MTKWDTCDLRFALWDAAAGGTQVCAPQSVAAQPVRNGLFAVELDFGAGAFTGEARWLEIAVQGPGGGGYTTLSPRQKLTATPHALYSLVAAYARTADIQEDYGAILEILEGATTDARIIIAAIQAADELHTWIDERVQ